MKSVSKVDTFAGFAEGKAKLPLRVAPFGIPVAQTWLQVAKLLSFIDHYDIKTFIELGIWQGGFSALLIARACYMDFHYVGVENNKAEVSPDVIDCAEASENATIILSDMFSETVQREIESKIDESQGPIFVYCDGGNKPREMKTYSTFLRPSDYIGCHDYPGEITDEDLEFLDDDPEFKEIEPNTWRNAIGVGIPIFKRISCCKEK